MKRCCYSEERVWWILPRIALLRDCSLLQMGKLSLQIAPALHRVKPVKQCSLRQDSSLGTPAKKTRSTTCPGLCCLSTSQGSSCLGTLGSSPAFYIQVQDHEAGANSWRCAEGAWRLPQQMNHHGLIFNSRLLLPSSISPSSPSLHTAFLLLLSITPPPSSAVVPTTCAPSSWLPSKLRQSCCRMNQACVHQT